MCKHDWKLLSEIITESQLELTTRLLPKRTKDGQIPWQLTGTERKIIQVATCNKCGKLRKLVTKIS